MDIERRYLYKISRNGVYLGLLPFVTSEFSYNQQINTGAAQTVINVDQSLDTAGEAPPILTAEDGTWLTTENGIPITAERSVEIVGNKDSARIIANFNDIEIIEISSDYPNGISVFTGYISKWSSKAGSNNLITITCISYSKDLDDYIYGNQSHTLQVSQTTSGSGDGFFTTYRFGQDFVTGAAQTDVSKIVIRLNTAGGNTRTVTVRLWRNTGEATIGATPLGSVSQDVNAASPTEFSFVFATAITVTSGTSYFFTVEVDSGSIFADSSTWIGIDSSDTNTYASGQKWRSVSGGSWINYTDSDIYFKVYSGTLLIDAVFTATDPGTMVKNAVDDYVTRGGSVSYISANVDLAGYTLNYTFSMATILEIVNKARELAPSDWYWYVNPATQSLYFKQTLATATHKMILGRHLEDLEIEASIEDIVNVVYFTGGPTAGVNLLKKYTDIASSAINRLSMRRLTDNRVTDATTASTLGEAFIDENDQENFRATITINSSTYDITLFDPGDTLAVQGFGDFVDSLVFQITQLDRHENYAVLTLGKLPLQNSLYVDQIRRDLDNQATLDNPTAPS